jgi:hypothetical protein
LQEDALKEDRLAILEDGLLEDEKQDQFDGEEYKPEENWDYDNAIVSSTGSLYRPWMSSYSIQYLSFPFPFFFLVHFN